MRDENATPYSLTKWRSNQKLAGRGNSVELLSIWVKGGCFRFSLYEVFVHFMWEFVLLINSPTLKLNHLSRGLGVVPSRVYLFMSDKSCHFARTFFLYLNVFVI